jgi:hypothetical protein
MKTIAQQLNVKDFPFEIRNKEGLQIYYEDLDGYWSKAEYNEQGKDIYYEDSNGTIIDYRPKVTELSLWEIATKFNIPISQLKIKK